LTHSQSSNVSLDEQLRSLSPEELRQTAATLLANDLEAFCREAWPIVEPEPFISAWYWTAMCEYLSAASARCDGC
jgi:hypothetical protein